MNKKSGGYSIMDDNRIQAVHDDDLRALLTSLGVLDGVNNGEYHCIFCQNEDNEDNIGAILPLDRSIAFTCNASCCVDKLIEGGENNVY